jgi:hypothetical protein
MKAEKRVLKGYKIKDSTYKKAMKRAIKAKVPLANMIEMFVEAIADGQQVRGIKYEGSTATANALDFIAPRAEN